MRSDGSDSSTHLQTFQNNVNIIHTTPAIVSRQTSAPQEVASYNQLSTELIVMLHGMIPLSSTSANRGGATCLHQSCVSSSVTRAALAAPLSPSTQGHTTSLPGSGMLHVILCPSQRPAESCSQSGSQVIGQQQKKMNMQHDVMTSMEALPGPQTVSHAQMVVWEPVTGGTKQQEQ